MIYDNEIPQPDQVLKYLYAPSRCVFFSTNQEHKTVAEQLGFKPTDAGMIAIGIDFFAIPNKHSASLGISTDRRGIIGLEAFLGRVFREN